MNREDESRSLMEKLKNMQDETYRIFTARLSKDVPDSRILGIRAPQLKKVAKTLSLQEKQMLYEKQELPYLEMEQLAVYALNQERDPSVIFRALQVRVPAFQTWALTDTLTLPYVSDTDLLKQADLYLQSDQSYVMRQGIIWIMKRAVRPPFTDQKRIQAALAVDCTKREVQMAKAWLLCEIMIHVPDLFECLLLEQTDPAVQKMAIGKCFDSRRIDETARKKLRMLKKKLSHA